jgi:rubrerythrin
VTGVPIGSTRQNLTSCYEGETYEATQMYPGFAQVAREEGFAELAKWFDSLAKVEKSHADLYAKALKSLT